MYVQDARANDVLEEIKSRTIALKYGAIFAFLQYVGLYKTDVYAVCGSTKLVTLVQLLCCRRKNCLTDPCFLTGDDMI